MISLPSITTIIGITGSGKSHLCKWLVKDLAFHKKINNIGVISTTIIEGSDKDDWSSIPTHKKMNYDVAEEYITNLIKYHRNLEKQNINYHSLVIIDDCMGLIKFNNDKWVVILSTCRHYNISFIIIAQYIKKLPTIVRSQSSYFFFFRMTDHLEFRGCFETCFSNMKYNDFKLFVNSIGKYQAIFFDKKNPNNNDRVRLIQAPSHISSFFINC